MKRINDIYIEQNNLTNKYHELINDQKRGFERLQDEFYEKSKRKKLKNQIRISLVKNRKAFELGKNLFNKISQSNDFESNTKAASKKHEMNMEINKFYRRLLCLAARCISLGRPVPVVFPLVAVRCRVRYGRRQPSGSWNS